MEIEELKEDLECTMELLRMYKQRIVRLEERLCISPYGEDRIDELELSIELRDFELRNVKDKLQKAIDAIEMHHAEFHIPINESTIKLWKTLEELR